MKIIRITTVPVSLHKLLGNQLSFINKYYEVIAVASKGELLNKVASEQGVKVVGVNMTRKVSPVQDFISLLRLYLLIRREKPLIVHTHTPKAGLLGMLAAWMARVPVRLHTVAGLPLLESRGFNRKILELTEKITSACAHKIYPNSHIMLEIMRDNNLCSPKKLKVIAHGSSNGINTEQFSALHYDEEARKLLREKLGILPQDKVLCFIGRVVTDKGVNELVEAFTKLFSKYTNLKLLIVGPFERELDALHEQTEKSILQNCNICFIDYQEDVRPFLAISNIFILPSYREGFPNVVMQAGAMGVPAIVSDINGCNEIIKDGENGLIVPVKNSKALEEAIEYLLVNENVLKKMSAKSRKMIVDRYDQQYVWDEILKEYQSFHNSSRV